MVPYLPPEIIQTIIDNVDFDSFHYPSGTRDLAHCCRTSKTFFAFAQPLLYRSIRIDQSVEVNRADDITRIGVSYWTKRLLSILQDNPRVCELVQEVRIQGCEGACFRDDDDDADRCVLWDAIDLFPALRIVELRNLVQFSGMEEAVELAQAELGKDEHRRTTPVFRLLAEEEDEDHIRLGWLGAVYEGYCRKSNHSYREVGWEEMLERSMNTLTRLEIPFDHTTSLFGFNRLEYLMLRLSDGQYSYHGIREDFGSNLLRHLTALKSLRALILAIPYLSSNPLAILLRTGSLAASLPPFLSFLSLQAPIDFPDILAFVNCLPITTTLRMLNYWGEEDVKQHFELVCGKRGITLNLNEEWSL